MRRFARIRKARFSLFPRAAGIYIYLSHNKLHILSPCKNPQKIFAGPISSWHGRCYINSEIKNTVWRYAMNNLINYKPVGAFDLLGDFNRVLDSFFTDTPVWKSRIPAVNVREEEKNYVLEAELPGLSQKDVDVKVEDNLLTISSVQSEEKDEKKNGYLIRERSNSSFKRSFVLPKNVDKENISAKFKNGLLILEIQKKQEDIPRSIEVKIE
jgi:HSP20 family molecular chaperone IbpA